MNYLKSRTDGDNSHADLISNAYSMLQPMGT